MLVLTFTLAEDCVSCPLKVSVVGPVSVTTIGVKFASTTEVVSVGLSAELSDESGFWTEVASAGGEASKSLAEMMVLGCGPGSPVAMMMPVGMELGAE